MRRVFLLHRKMMKENEEKAKGFAIYRIIKAPLDLNDPTVQMSCKHRVGSRNVIMPFLKTYATLAYFHTFHLPFDDTCHNGHITYDLHL